MSSHTKFAKSIPKSPALVVTDDDQTKDEFAHIGVCTQQHDHVRAPRMYVSTHTTDNTIPKKVSQPCTLTIQTSVQEMESERVDFAKRHSHGTGDEGDTCVPMHARSRSRPIEAVHGEGRRDPSGQMTMLPSLLNAHALVPPA